MEWENQRVSTPSTPNSVGSHSTSSSRPPSFKPMQPSSSISALAKLTDEDLRRKGVDDLTRIIRRVENDYKVLMGEQGHMVKEVTRKMQIYLMEIRGLKENNQKVQEECQELRDLCCFLDDDRQRGRKLAREWQRFGRYTASVMRSEVAVYQDKLKELEQKQEELISQNMELKELCLYLDQERIHMTQDRDDGDGSSSGTMAGQEDGVHITENDRQQTPTQANISNIPDHTAQYIRQLEDKLRILEDDRKQLAQRVERNGAEGFRANDRNTNNTNTVKSDLLQDRKSSPNTNPSPSNTSKPEAVVHAMKVLQVHEQLERSRGETGDENLDDKELAIVREMCNVVWRKLGDGKPENPGSRQGHQAPTQQQQRPPPYNVLPSSRPPSTVNQPTQPSNAYLSNHQFQPHHHGNRDPSSYHPSAPPPHHYSNQHIAGHVDPPQHHHTQPPPYQNTRQPASSRSPSYFLDQNDPPPPPPPHMPYNNHSSGQLSSRPHGHHSLPPPPPPPASSRGEYYHQEWRQTYMDGNNPP
ncbi:hypothetical protein SNE40_009444 [Patella caerulea]|uniref:Coiled-coil domain-containing protein 85C n=1 Tax=Patella caerulea TaxID=87958 RepID=A0AAN8JNT6_PATCE